MWLFYINVKDVMLEQTILAVSWAPGDLIEHFNEPIFVVIWGKTPVFTFLNRNSFDFIYSALHVSSYPYSCWCRQVTVPSVTYF